MSKLKKTFLIVLVIFLAILPLFFKPSHKSNKTVIKFSSWGSQSEIAILKPILSEFEAENPDIKVDFVHIPQNYFQKLHLLFASNLAPDVVFINNLYLPIYANAGVLEPLSDKSNSRVGLLSRQDIDGVFFKKSLAALSYDGKIYAVPRDVSNLVIYYNKDIFKKYKVKVPSKYWSYNDFLLIAQKLTKDTNGDGKTDVWGMGFEEDPFYFLPFLMSEGGGYVSDDLKTQIIDSAESQKGLNFYADLRNKYHVAPTDAEAGSATMAQLFLQGKLAMQISGRWLVPKYREDANFSWNVINFPAGDKGSIVPLDASGWAVAKSSRHKDAAIRLVKFLSSDKSIEKFSKSGLIVPARIDVARGKFLSSKNLPPKNDRVFVDVIKTAKPTPVSVNYNEILDDIKQKTGYLFDKN
jgi:multiple sugar transport system substrate-binding protein